MSLLPPTPGTEAGDTTVEGTLERIVFRAAGSPFVVARMRTTGAAPEMIAIVGELGNLDVGIALRLHGHWENDKKYGRQYRFESFQTITPETKAGIERYLGSGMVPGLGIELARRIVARFGHETLEIIHNTPERLTEVEGIGKVRAARIRDKWLEQREIQDVMVFLHGHGVSTAFAWRIYKKYGAQSCAIVRENPYRLALEVWGIGFRSADAIARKLGIERTSPARAEAGMLHVLGELHDEGHVHAPEHSLLAEAEKTLEVGVDILAPAIDRLALAGRVMREELGDRGTCVAVRALYEAEKHAAEGLARILHGPARAPILDLDETLAAFEEDRKISLATQQRAAVAAAVREKVTVITGGPGVGKTTIVNAVIRILEREGRRVVLGAPTGRAAKRLSETTGRTAMTLHRLLEFSPQHGGFGRGMGAPLIADAVIVDETSMLDVVLAAQLFGAVPDHAQLVLVGDVDQLPSVGPGRILADVIASRAVCVVRLTEIFRQAAASAIVTNAHRVNRGEMPDLETRPGSDFFFISREEPKDVLATLLDVVAGRIGPGFGLDPIDDVQVLTPMHRGDVGAKSLNAELQARLNPPGPPELAHGNRRFRVGDKVIQLKNDYDKEVWNGDVGRVIDVVATDEATELRVEIDGRSITYVAEELDQLGHAFALSVHKSQGSEYPAVVIPIVTQHYMMLKRNLLYTALTRGKRVVVLIGSKKALGIAVRTDDTRMRWTWLAERIKELVR